MLLSFFFTFLSLAFLHSLSFPLPAFFSGQASAAVLLYQLVQLFIMLLFPFRSLPVSFFVFLLLDTELLIHLLHDRLFDLPRKILVVFPDSLRPQIM